MKALLTFLSLAAPLCLCAQPVPDTLWTRTYGTLSADVAYHIMQTTDGGFLLTGTHDQFDPQIYAVKTTANGEQQWARVYALPPLGEFSDEWAVGGGSLAGGGILLAASCVYYEPVGPNEYASRATGCLIRCAANGDTLSSALVAGRGNALFTHLDVVADGGFIITGLTFDTDTTTDEHDVLLVRLDAAGSVLWWSAIPTAAPVYPACVRAVGDGFVVAGESVSLAHGDSDGFLMKTDGAGDTLWTRTYREPANETLRSVRALPDGGFVLVGQVLSSEENGEDMWLVRADAEGNLLWQWTYGGIGSERGYDVQPLADGRLVVLGDTTVNASLDVDVCLLITDAQGRPLTCRRYGGPDGDVAQSLTPTADGGFAAAGWTWSHGNGSDDFYLLRFALPTAADEDAGLYPSSFHLSASPNPFNAVTRLTFELPRAAHVTLTVYDVTGRLSAVLINSLIPAGAHETLFDARALTSGVYFVHMRAGEFAATRKVLLVR